jgi:hypothetical protein
VPLHVLGQVGAGIVAVVLVDDVAEERPHLSLVAATPAPREASSSGSWLKGI